MADADIGLIGLGTMGAALSLNIAEKGFRIAVYNRTASRTEALMEKAGDLAGNMVATTSLEDLIAAIKPPRAIILMVPAGEIVDLQIEALRPLLDDDDMIIDAGNANFHDTNRRAAEAVEAGVPYLGIGVSGGEEGARHGPSIMGGGDKAAWDRVASILTAIAAKYEGEACATLMGETGSGHFVKTVHNGIEYADMQMIAEVYGYLRDGVGRSAGDIGAMFDRWNEGPLKSYLVEITGKIGGYNDPETGKPMLDVILDKAGQKGTGRWTVIEAQQVGAPIPVIDAAVAARNMSAFIETRKAGEDRFGAAPIADDDALDDATLEGALIAGKIMCYAQGFDLLGRAGATYDWSLPMPEVAKVWREGCIIRSEMLNDMATALGEEPERNLMLAPYFADLLETHAPSLRLFVARAMAHGIAVPALSAALGYFDTMRTARGTANMIQAQRDFFGAHGFVRLDTGEEDQHGPWGG